MVSSPSGKPIGPLVEPPTAKWPAQTSLTGRLVSVVPRHRSHFKELFDALGGERNAGLWDYMLYGPFLDLEEFCATLENDSQSPDYLAFAVIDNASKRAVGSISLMAINLRHRRIEVGNIIFSADLQGTIASTEVQYLLACLVFDSLSYRRYEWKCNDLNAPSKRAALRLGFRFDGVFRQHMIVKGRNRDTAWYSITDGEWHAVKRGFEKWLDDGNFDQQGSQRKSLAALRDAVDDAFAS